MNLNHLYYFTELAKMQKMSATAKKLGIAQPTLSYAIHALEADLGIQLFSRAGRQLTLTPAGQFYYHKISQNLNQIQQASVIVSGLQPDSAGLTRIGVDERIGSELLAQPIADFLHQPANKSVGIELVAGSFTALSKQLANHTIDWFITIQAPDNTLNHSWTVQPLMNLRFSVLTTNERFRTPTWTPDQLANHRIVTIQSLAETPLLKSLQESNINITWADTASTVISLVQKSVGLGLVLQQAFLTSSNLKPATVQSSFDPITVAIVSDSLHPLSPAATRFKIFTQAKLYEGTSFPSKK